VYSTDLYPGWPFAASTRIPHAISTEVAKVLLTISPDNLAAVSGRYNGWTVAVNYQAVHDCLRNLMVGPYASFGKVTLVHIFSVYGKWIVAIVTLLVALLLGLLAVWSLNRRLAVLQRELQKNEERFRSLFEHMPSGVVVYEAIDEGKDFIVKNMNAASLLLSRLKKEDVVGKRVTEKFPSVEKIGLLAVLQRVWQNGKSEFLPGIYYDDSRLKQWVENHVYRLGSGEVVVVYNDISSRKRNELMLQEKTSFLQELIDAIPAPVYYKDNDLRYLGCNKAFATLVTDGRESIIGKTVFDIFRGEEAEIHHQKDLELLANPGSNVYLQAMQPKFGHKKEVVFHKANFFNADGSVGGLVGVLMDVTARKQAEQAMQQAKEYAELLFNVAPVAIFTVDLKQRVTSWNKKAEQLTGYSEKEVLWKSCMVFSEDPCREKCGLLSADVGKPVVGRECTIRRKDGKIIVVSKNVDELRGIDGKVIGGVECFEDITARRRMEDQLAQHHHLLKNVINNIPHFVYWKDRDSRFLGCNERFAVAVGLKSPEDVVQKTDFDLLWREDEARFYQQADQAVMDSGEAAFNFQETWRLPDGRELVLFTCRVPLRNEKKDIVGMMAIYADITELKAIEQKVKAQEEMMRYLINTIPAFVFWKDRELRYLGCNEAFARAAGVTNPGEIVGKSDADLSWVNGDLEANLIDEREVIKTGQPQLEFIETRRLADEKDHFLLTSKVPLHNREGAVSGLLAFLSDVTKLKDMEAELLQSQSELERMVKDLEDRNQQLKTIHAQLLQTEKMSAVGRLSAGVAHEIKNPLAIILLTLESLSELSHADDFLRERLAMIHDAAQRANRVVVELLSFSRVSEMKAQHVSIRETLGGAILLLKSQLQLQRVTVDSEYAEDELFIGGDAIMLKQLFLNLLANSLDALGGGGRIVLRGYRQVSPPENEERIVVEIEDNGSGINEADLPKIFDPFFTTKEVGKGTGLGLSVVYMVLEKHQGKIAVESAVGKGTKIVLSFPALKETGPEGEQRAGG